ncbi:MAG: AEC family transporter [Clostridia bacterium]|nr:AEC family transporter [Clostridia bacterium]
MDLFLSTLNQMAFLLLLMVIGYILTRFKLVPDNAHTVLSKLENNVFIPALVMGTFMTQFTVARLNVAWQFLLGGFVVIGLTAPLASLLARFCTKDDYLRKIYAYGLAFSNFGFMGNAVVQALFPHIFMEYLIFVLPFWMLIYTWGVPVLLIPAGEGKRTLGQKLKPFLNPMLIGMLIGMVIGLIAPPTLGFFGTAVTTLGNCMSPVAMLLTGMTIAKIDLKAAFRNVPIYVVSLIRLVAIPLVAILIMKFLPLPNGLSVCIICALAMPLGLTPIVVPSGYGMDTSDASAMALISHLLSIATIPLIFLLFQAVVV